MADSLAQVYADLSRNGHDFPVLGLSKRLEGPGRRHPPPEPSMSRGVQSLEFGAQGCEGLRFGGGGGGLGIWD